MKSIATITFYLIFSLKSIAQTGAAAIQISDAKTGKEIQNQKIEFWQDSILLETKTSDSEGKLFVKDLPSGMITWKLNDEKETKGTQGILFIQMDQILRKNIFIDSLFRLRETSDSRHYQFSKNGSASNPANRSLDCSLLSTASFMTSYVQEIQCLSVCAYRVPLINMDQSGIANYISNEEIKVLPSRDVRSMVANSSQVHRSEKDDGIHIRGARNYGTTYYLDGMRIDDVRLLPKSYLGSITLYTGGIPANFGDVTGGIINVQSKGIDMRMHYPKTEFDLYAPQLRQEYLIEEQFYSDLNSDHFLPIYENVFLSPLTHPNSTFGIDVDRASWTYLKTQIRNGNHINRDAVKMEEIINSYTYSNHDFKQTELINVRMERSYCAWNEESELVSIVLKAMDLPDTITREPYNFVFLVDVSGSMNSANKLPLLIKGLNDFVNTLNENDKIAIVTYAGNAGVVLDPTYIKQKQKILNALSTLSAGGSTNGIGGIEAAYSLAEQNFDQSANNRIILATDGDFNVGINSIGDLENYIFQKRGKGIYLTALGFGMGNYKNSILETLADKGDGNHFYINDLTACKKALIDDIGNLITIARDVKLNVEFNPRLVKEYRLIGYENRLLKPRDFNDDTKDGGEMGYGHFVTAVYEIKRGKSEECDNHFVKERAVFNSSELAYVRLRYKKGEDSLSIEQKFSLSASHEIEQNKLLNAVIAFGLVLRDSMFKGDMTTSKLLKLAGELEAKNDAEQELIQLVELFQVQ